MIEKNYKAIFFDWDGTAVVSRTHPADEVLPHMIALLEKGIKLFIISGTTYQNISKGNLHEQIPKYLLKNLYLGLGRGAFNYGFDEQGNMILMNEIEFTGKEKTLIDEICFLIHKKLFEEYNYPTDIVFSRPNYCKIDLLVDRDRKGNLFLQPEEIDMVNQKLVEHGYKEGIKGLMQYAVELGEQYKIHIEATTDAKYLEVGMSTKTNNVDFLIQEIIGKNGIEIQECCFWGDEYTYLGKGIQGSDAFMITKKTKKADFYDVCEHKMSLPPNVQYIGGGTKAFIEFLKTQNRRLTNLEKQFS